MTGRRPPYLFRRGALYYLRLPIPKDLQALFGRTEIRRSLKTADAQEASYHAHFAAFNFGTFCRRIRNMTNSMDLDVPRMVQNFLSELMNAVSPELPTSDYDWHEVEYGEEIELDRIERMISIQRFDRDVEHNAVKLLNGIDLTMDQVPAAQRRQLLDGIARAQREAIYYQKHVRTQPFSTYSFHDRDLASVDLKLASIGLPGLSPTPDKASLSSFVETYLNSDAHGWTKATRKEKRVPLAWFVQQIGAERDIKGITPADILAFRDAMLKVRKHVPAGTPLSKAQTDVVAKRVNPKTSRKKFDTVMAFMRWLYKLGEIEFVPANGISIKVPKTPKTKQRRPFEPSELDQLFASPLYSGCRSLARRSFPGNVIHLDDEYWMPLLLMYTGMRISEPLQLAAHDISIDGPHPFIRLDESKLELKTSAADRIVPLHSDLEKFGFLDFVEARKKKAPKQRLFRKITSKGDVGNYYSKKIGRYLSAIGLSDPRLVAHSFRHGFKTALRNAAVPEGEQHFLMGHSDSSTAHGYGLASDIEVLHGWVAKLDFKLSDETRDRLTSNRSKGPAR